MNGSNIAGIAVPDPDLFHQDPYIRGGGGGGLGWSTKKLFRPVGPQCGLQIEKLMCKM